MPYSDRDKKINLKQKVITEVLQNCTKTQIISDVPVPCSTSKQYDSVAWHKVNSLAYCQQSPFFKITYVG